MMRRLYLLLLAALIMGNGGSSAATVEVELTNVQNDHGLVRAMICTEHTFGTKRCAINGAAPAELGTVTVTINELPPGAYAIQAYHDEDGSGRLRRGMFGIPSEAVGFSRDAPLHFGSPRYADAVIFVTEPTTHIRIRLRHVGG